MGKENIEHSKIISPSRSYKIRLNIKGTDYSNELVTVKITSSLATGYQIVILTILVTPRTILLNKLYGQDSINLIIALLDQSEQENKNLSFNLMILDTEFEVPMTEILDSGSQRDRTGLVLITVMRIPFQIMSTNVGCVFGYGNWTGGKTPRTMIETMVKTFTPQANLEYDVEGENDNPITQCCVPPNSLYSAIKLIDNNHGLYSGVPAVFCQYDNTIQIMNLSTRIKKDFTLYIEHLTTDYKLEDVTTSMDKRFFYTYDNLNSTYTGNSKFGILGNTLKHIVLPSDQLSYTIVQDLNDICINYGVLGTENKETIYVDSEAIQRTTYYIENNGDDTDENHAISKIAKKISDLSRLSFSIERGLSIENLLKIGNVVKLGSRAIDYVDLTGKYILFASDISWNKEGEWQTTAKLELIRTNKTI